MTRPTEPLSDAPQPTERDRANAAMREAIARRQAEEYGDCLSLAEAAFGPGWRPSHRHMLIEHDEEDRARRTWECAVPAATVYTVKNDVGQQRHFIVSPDGTVTECAGYQAGFGDMLLEPHPTRGFTDKQGRWCRTHRYSLCWSGYELYQPQSAEQLAKLRASRERNKAVREEQRWAEDNPLLAWAERMQQGEGEKERGDRQP